MSNNGGNLADYSIAISKQTYNNSRRKNLAKIKESALASEEDESHTSSANNLMYETQDLSPHLKPVAQTIQQLGRAKKELQPL